MEQYECLKVQTQSIGDYQICPLRYEDMALIREWRNQQIDVLRQKKILTAQDQENYYQSVIKPLYVQKQPSQILFSYLKNMKTIGYGGFVHINWVDRRAELSFLVDTARTQQMEVYQEDFLNYLELIKRAAFNVLDLNRIYTETFDIRDFHISILEKAGFLPEGRLKEHNIINGSFVDSIMHGYVKRYFNI